MTECEEKKKGAFVLLFLSPGDAAVVQPLLSSHNDVESAAKVVWLHIHDLMTKHMQYILLRTILILLNRQHLRLIENWSHTQSEYLFSPLSFPNCRSEWRFSSGINVVCIHVSDYEMYVFFYCAHMSPVYGYFSQNRLIKISEKFGSRIGTTYRQKMEICLV